MDPEINGRTVHSDSTIPKKKSIKSYRVQTGKGPLKLKTKGSAQTDKQTRGENLREEKKNQDLKKKIIIPDALA